jgi:hypothetical protein
MKHAACLFCFAAAWALSALAFSAADEPAAKPPQSSEQQIAAWIKALDADEFHDRETAMLQLLEAGPAVLPALRPILTGGSLEATSRAFFVVRQLGVSDSEEAQQQAAELLTELASRNEAPAMARRAAAALAELTQQRSARALVELEKLGAKIARLDTGGLFGESVQSIEIGEAFTGDVDDLRRLRWIIDVPLLLLTTPRATDAWLKHAAAMPSLEELHLYQAAISDDGLAPLKDNTTLRQLGLYYTPVGDKALAPLEKLPLLSFVKLYGTKVSEAGIAKFKEASGMAVDFRRGAFLGVGCQSTEPCIISTVHPGSPAANGGLLRDDTILRFLGKPIKNFDTLTELIRRCEVGDEVEIEVRRLVQEDGQVGHRNVTAKLTLAPWDLEAAVRNSRR